MKRDLVTSLFYYAVFYSIIITKWLDKHGLLKWILIIALTVGSYKLGKKCLEKPARNGG